MKSVFIVEKMQSPLLVAESMTERNTRFLEGVFTEFNIVNRNGRVYNSKNFVPVLEAKFAEMKDLGAWYGEYDHPDNYNINPHNVSHTIESVVYDKENERIMGKIKLLPNTLGKDIRAMVEDGNPIFVSSRAAGRADGINVMVENIVTYDVVLNPGFKSARVNPLNESLGFTQPNPTFMIYEMNDIDFHKLHTDNANNNKTMEDIKHLEQYIENRLAEVINQITSANPRTTSTAEVLKLQETLETLLSEQKKIQDQISYIEKKVSIAVSSSSEAKNITESIQKEVEDLTYFHNHLADSIKQVREDVSNVDTELKNTISFIEHVANEANEEIKSVTESVSDVNLSVAKMTNEMFDINTNLTNELQTTQKFIEHVAGEADKEIFITQKFIEHVASETELTQKFVEHVAGEANVDSKWLEYIFTKVDGTIKFLAESQMFKESKVEGKSIREYLNLNEEEELMNSISNANVQAQPNVQIQDDPTSNVDLTPIDNTGMDTMATNVAKGRNTAAPEVTAEDPACTDEPCEENGTVEDLMHSIVKLLSNDETAIIIEILPDNKLKIKKSDDTEMEVTKDEIEVLDDTNIDIKENLSSVLNKIKEQNVLSSTTPHFFNFLNETQIANFKALSIDKQEKVILAMNEREYYTSNDVLNHIGKILNASPVSYEERMINNIPADLKEAWNQLPTDSKKMILAESKYHNLITTEDIHNFFKSTRFAKQVNSPEAILLKESFNTENTDDSKLSDNVLNAYLRTIENLK